MRRLRFVVLAAVSCAVLALAVSFTRRAPPGAGVVFAQSQNAAPHCVPVGGTFMSNLAVIGQSTTLGVATGDLRGAVAATILNASPGAGSTTVFAVQHHFVTDTGDTIQVDRAEATVTSVTPTLFGVVTYPIKITGGTGRFAGATGTINNIGEVDVPNFPDLTGGTTVFRYSGQVCFAAPSKP